MLVPFTVTRGFSYSYDYYDGDSNIFQGFKRNLEKRLLSACRWHMAVNQRASKGKIKSRNRSVKWAKVTALDFWQWALHYISYSCHLEHGADAFPRTTWLSAALSGLRPEYAMRKPIALASSSTSRETPTRHRITVEFSMI